MRMRMGFFRLKLTRNVHVEIQAAVRQEFCPCSRNRVEDARGKFLPEAKLQILYLCMK